ncbi:MAG: Stp1/IreP family PP2C-type Ser/Thr phosphatase [Deltaproteobacteria bacterium]|nr:Stp1/IreP family PP2C-type Ser/Thr phosphatase [Deltaproteobacteria bacterium]
MRITSIGLSDVGLQREHNEDSFLLLDEYTLYLVADGMGGHQAGDVASKMALETVSSFFAATQEEDATWPFPVDPHLSLAENRLCSSIKMANKQIFDLANTDHALEGMGTTIVAIAFNLQKEIAYIAHVGDSRAYRIRNGEILQITRDHSLVNDYLNMMPDMPAEAMEVVPRNVITRALGMQDSVVVDLRQEQVVHGDRFLLCTDGLSGQVADQKILEVLSDGESSLADCGKVLIKEANDAGGEDNVTVVIMHCE